MSARTFNSARMEASARDDGKVSVAIVANGVRIVTFEVTADEADRIADWLHAKAQAARGVDQVSGRDDSAVPPHIDGDASKPSLACERTPETPRRRTGRFRIHKGGSNPWFPWCMVHGLTREPTIQRTTTKDDVSLYVVQAKCDGVWYTDTVEHREVKARIAEIHSEHARRCDYDGATTTNPGYGHCRCGFLVDDPRDHSDHVATLIAQAVQPRIDTVEQLKAIKPTPHLLGAALIKCLGVPALGSVWELNDDGTWNDFDGTGERTPPEDVPLPAILLYIPEES